MVYRFDRAGAGEMVAEAVRSGIGSFMGLNHSASDVPAPAHAGVTVVKQPYSAATLAAATSALAA